MGDHECRCHREAVLASVLRELGHKLDEQLVCPGLPPLPNQGGVGPCTSFMNCMHGQALWSNLFWSSPATEMMSSLLGQVFLYCLFMVSGSHAHFFRGCPTGPAPGTQEPANQPSAPGICLPSSLPTSHRHLAFVGRSHQRARRANRISVLKQYSLESCLSQ